MSDKTCCLCNKPMGSDDAFIKIHNICRQCLESGKEIENITNNVFMPLTRWESTHIKQCKNCNATYVSLWYGSIHCGPCVMKRASKQKQRAETRLEKFKNMSPEDFQEIREKRIKKYFQGLIPFDVATICRVMSEKYILKSEIDTYELLYDFFITGYPLWILSKKFNRSKSSLDRIINKLCFKILGYRRYYYLFMPIKHLPKAEKIKIIQHQISNIKESQSRTEQ